RGGAVLPDASRADVPTGRAQRHAAQLFHLGRDAHAARPGALAPAGAGPGRAAARAVARRSDAPAAHVVHGEAPLRGGLVGDRELARRSGVRDRRALPPATHRALHQLRVVRRAVLEWMGPGERPAPANHPGVRHERQSAAAGARRAAAALFTHEARIQADQVSGVDDIHGYETGRILGRPGVSLVWGNLARTVNRSPPARRAARVLTDTGPRVLSPSP